MKGFRFKLEPVLAIRRHREEVLQRELADAQRELVSEQLALDSTLSALERRVGEFKRKVQPGPLDMGLLGLESEYLPFLERELERQLLRVQEQRQRVAEQIEALLVASRDKKALEKLEENLRAAHVREAARKEQNAAEDMASIRHLRRQLVDSESAATATRK